MLMSPRVTSRAAPGCPSAHPCDDNWGAVDGDIARGVPEPRQARIRREEVATVGPTGGSTSTQTTVGVDVGDIEVRQPEVGSAPDLMTNPSSVSQLAGTVNVTGTSSAPPKKLVPVSGTPTRSTPHCQLPGAGGRRPRNMRRVGTSRSRRWQHRGRGALFGWRRNGRAEIDGHAGSPLFWEFAPCHAMPTRSDRELSPPDTSGHQVVAHVDDFLVDGDGGRPRPSPAEGHEG
jgi:hypothetical protein